jgi:3-oxoacyl-[acyl-carrier-protein] synthase II
MGEEAAGIDAVRVAVARITSGQSDIALVGGAYNGERKDALIYYEFAGHILKRRFAPVWERRPEGGFALASLGAFLVIETRQHAQARGVEPIARISAVLAARSDRHGDALAANLESMWDQVSGQVRPDQCAIVSGASGAEPATAQEQKFLSRHPQFAVRASGSYIGHALEPQFPMNIALAATALRHGKLFPPCPGTDVEQPMPGPLTQAIVTGVGHWRGEGLALVEAP